MPIQSTMASNDDNSLQEPPQQSAEERRNIRKKYRELLDETGAESDMTINKLNLKLLQAEELFQNVHTPREHALDSKFMEQASNLALRRAQAIGTSRVQFNLMDFAEQAARFLSSGAGIDGSPVVSSEDWRDFGKRSSALFKKAPNFPFMFGAFERNPEPKAVKEKKPKEKDTAKSSTEVVPKNVTEMGKSDQEMTTEEVERVLSILRKIYHTLNKPICFYEFTVDPESFSRTMENIFHVSFLVRDGFAVIFTDDDGLPVIEPMMGGNGVADQRGFKNQQMAISMTPAEHEIIVRTFKIERALIPPPR